MKKSIKAAHGTGEWAASNVNIQDGCEHDCRYCYAKCMAIRFKRKTPGNWKKPRLRKSLASKTFLKREGRIMFPTSHDITPSNVQAAIQALQSMLTAGNEVLIVMKPDLGCVRALCAALSGYKDRITFRFTICSANDKVLKFWEPGAPSFKARLAALKKAFSAGYQTSVSCEPMLDGNIGAVISKVRQYVTDSIWLGKANRLRGIIRINCPGDEAAKTKVEELIRIQNDSAIRALYARYKGDRLIKWKDSIKQVIGIARPAAKGLDV